MKRSRITKRRVARIAAVATVALVANVTPSAPGWLAPASASGDTIIAVAVGDEHSCAVIDDGSVKCWGDNAFGQLGLGDTIDRGRNPGEMGPNLPAVDLGTGRTAVALTAGSGHTCALLDNDAVKCWGQNDFGQLGLGNTTLKGNNPGEMGDALPAVDLGTGRSAVAITAGLKHNCALLDDDSVKCWGVNGAGQLGSGNIDGLGDDTGEMGDNLPAVDLGTGRTAVSLDAGGFHNCAVLDDASLKCWGQNLEGQLGLGNTTWRGDDPGEMGNSLPAVNLGTGRTAVAVSAGLFHTCAVLDNDTSKCWGQNGNGQLGLGDTANRGDGAGEMGNSLPAVDLGTGRTAITIKAGYAYTCAVLDDASLKCWGYNAFGQLGQGDAVDRGDAAGEMGDALPALALGTGRSVVETAVGSDLSASTCALLDDASVKCWGYNGIGNLGLGDNTWRGFMPGQMGDDLPVVRIFVDAPSVPTGVAGAAGNGQVVVSWSAPANGGSAITDYQVDVYSISAGAPSGVTGPTSRFVGSAATSFTFTGLTNGTFYRFKVAAINPVGTGSQSALSTATTPITPTQVAAGVSHTCARGADGRVKCWGNNGLGHLGLGDNANRGDTWGELGDNLPAVALGTGRTAYSVTGGFNHTCARLSDGRVKCWGNSARGQLGQGDTTSRGGGPGQMGDSLPVISFDPDFVVLALDAGNFHNCVLLTDGRVKCWGWNAFGQLGQGDTVNAGDDPFEMGVGLQAVDLGTGRSAVAIAVGDDHSCALLDNATVKCWGANGSGQLGLGNTLQKGDGPGELGDALPAVNLGTGRTALAIDSSGGHTCALLDNASVKCWGLNGSGELGLGDTANRGDGAAEMGDALPAVDLGSGRTAVQISSGLAQTCAVLDDASVKCWGYNADGGLGLGDTANRGDGPGEMGDSLPAVALGSGRTATAVAAGGQHACAVLDDASVKCWGLNSSGELGSGDTDNRGDDPGEMGDALPAVTLDGANPVVVPRAPTAVASSPGSGEITVTWTPPVVNGGATITDYEVSVYDSAGGAPVGVTGATTRTVGSGATTFLFTGLTNGTAYRFRVAALNSAGTGPQSSLSPAINAGAPAPPTAVKAVSASTTAATTGSLIVSFTPGANNGAAITGFTATCTSPAFGVTRTASGAASPLTVTLATKARPYECTVTATNSRGIGSASALSPLVIVGSPAPPTAVKAVSSSTAVATGSLVVTFTIGVDNGAAITSKTATCTSSNGGVTKSGSHAGAAAAPVTVAAVTTGKTYTCTVKATNSRGAGLASASSGAVIVGSPAAPTGVKAVSNATAVATGSLVVTFTIGANNGAAITSKTATCTSSNGGVTKTATHVGPAAAPITVAAVTTGKTYTCSVKATNARGVGLAGTAPAVIVGSPKAPTGVAAVKVANGQLRVSFTPGANNGSPTTSYTATCASSNGGVTKTKVGAASPLTVTALTPGKSYTCSVKGTNARGAGLPSAPTGAVTA